jgi:hypothetical protein
LTEIQPEVSIEAHLRAGFGSPQGMEAGRRLARRGGWVESGLILLRFPAIRGRGIRQAGGIRVYRFPHCRSRFVALEVHCD